ncbi:MAG TPA: ribonuclease HI family protein, partial [Candidatus Paceibacterota bacterium]
EYQALLWALRWLVSYGHTEARIHSDSKLVVNQINGLWKVRDVKLQVLYDTAMPYFPGTARTLVHIPREQNKEADALVNRVLDELSKHTS